MEKNSDDAWNLFNLISTGDQVFGVCRRKIQKDSLTGLVKQEVKKFNVLLKVIVSAHEILFFLIFNFFWQNIDYDPDQDEIRILGTNCQENQYIGMGIHQAISIKAPMKMTLIKSTFDSIHVKKLKEATQG